MSNKKILPSILKINIFALIVIFGSVVYLNVNIALKIRDYEKVNNSIHDFSDLAQYAITLALKVKYLKKDESLLRQKYLESIKKFEYETAFRLNVRKDDFLKIYPEDTYRDLQKAILPMTQLQMKINETININDLLDELENSYILILKFSAEHGQLIDDFLSMKIKVLGVVLIVIIIFVLLALHSKIKNIITPLKRITRLSQKLSISANSSIDADSSHDKIYDYEEYQILAGSLREMHQRIHYENRVTSHESAASLVGNFAENLAHLINNPLAIIATSVKIIHKKSLQENLNFVTNETALILTELKRITDITHQMKSLIHSSAKSEPEYFKVGNLLTSIHLLFFNKFFERNIKFNHNLVLDTEIFAVENVVGQIISSLIENAIEYNDAKPPVIDLLMNSKENYITLSVRDNGSPPKHELILEKMNGNQNNISDLGLYTCALSAKKHGYSLTYNNSPKEFILTIPSIECPK